MLNLTVELDENLEQELRYIDQNLIDKATLKAQRSTARVVLKDAVSEAPSDTYTLKLALSTASELDKRRGLCITYVGLSKKNHPGWLVTRGLAMEYGNARVNPQPFLQPAAKRNRNRVFSQYRQFLDKHLDRLVARSGNR